jgi:hypothetical protein
VALRQRPIEWFGNGRATCRPEHRMAMRPFVCVAACIFVVLQSNVASSQSATIEVEQSGGYSTNALELFQRSSVPSVRSRRAFDSTSARSPASSRRSRMRLRGVSVHRTSRAARRLCRTYV